MSKHWYLAKSLEQLRKQINAQWPSRDKASDGSVGDLSHQKSKSEHNPNSTGAVRAIDIDADLSATENVGLIAAALQASKDPRIKYLIWNSHITIKGDVTKWKPYTGKNAHKHHLHISVQPAANLYDDPKPWNLNFTAPTEIPNVPRPLEFGMVGEDVRLLQAALKVKVDGSFGPNTLAAVKGFQLANGLRPDGMVGKSTRAALGI